jgi:hypothetical protein
MVNCQLAKLFPNSLLTKKLNGITNRTSESGNNSQLE